MIAEHATLCDQADRLPLEPSDREIVDTLAEAFDMPGRAVIERLICMDFVTVRGEVAP